MAIDTQQAVQAFRSAGIDPRADFHTLTGDQVDTVIAEADRARYRQPRNANGSRARYFFYAVQRKYEREM